MTTIRPLASCDVAAVGDLFVRVFQQGTGTASPSLREYFADLYLHNPWVDSGARSMVATDGDRIVGFLGVVPMPQRVAGRDITVGIGGSFMVSPDAADPFAATRLLRALLTSPVDVALTDTANATAIRFWERLGGHFAPVQSLRWLIPVRPAALGVHALGEMGPRRFVALAAPLARLADRVLERRWSLPDDASVELRPTSARTVFEVMRDIDDHRQVGFAGTADEFEWLVAMLHRKTRFGPLDLLTLHRRGGAPIGAMLYFPNRGAVGQLAFMTVADGHHADALTALRRYAREVGSVGVMGVSDRHLDVILCDIASIYVRRNDLVTLHSRNDASLQPLLSGDVAMTRLSGEWWTRLQGDAF